MSKALKKLRLDKGYTLQQISGIIGIDLTTYSKYEAGSIDIKKIHLGTFLKMALAYDVSCKELWNIITEADEHEE